MSKLQKVKLPLRNVAVMVVSSVPSILFFKMVNIPHSSSVESFILLVIGGIICLLGFGVSFRVLIHDKN